jgi:hypothetical protein
MRGEGEDPSLVMAGLDPAIHDLLASPSQERGCPGQVRA